MAERKFKTKPVKVVDVKNVPKVTETALEFNANDKWFYFTLTRKKDIRIAEKNAKNYPDKCVIIRRNEDGSVYGKQLVANFKFPTINTRKKEE